MERKQGTKVRNKAERGALLEGKNIDDVTRDRALLMVRAMDLTAARREQIIQQSSGGDPKQAQARIQRVEETKAFFTQPHEAWPQSPMISLAERFREVPQDAASQQALKVLLPRMVELLVVQHERDPRAFSPHDAAHALHVDRIADNLLEQHPEALQLTQELYGISAAEARLCMMLVNVLHDCGYPHLFRGKHTMKKATHSVYSADHFRGKDVQRAVAQLIRSSGAKKEVLLRDMANAIEWHGSDVTEELYSIRLTTDKGTFLTHPKYLQRVLAAFRSTENPTKVIRSIQQITVASEQTRDAISTMLNGDEEAFSLLQKIVVEESGGGFPGRAIDAKDPGDDLLGIEYRMKDLMKQPLLAQLVIADNLHAGEKRRRPYETDPAFWEVLEAIGNPQHQTAKNLKRILALSRQVLRGEGTIDVLKNEIKKLDPSFPFSEKQQNPLTLTSLFQQRIITETLRKVPGLTKSQRAFYELVGNEQIPPNFFHVGGHLAVKDIVIEGMNVIVKLSDRAASLPKGTAIERVHSSLGGNEQVIVQMDQYIAWRAEQAMESVRKSGARFTVFIERPDGTRFQPTYQPLSVEE